jgi:hypothetical protein
MVCCPISGADGESGPSFSTTKVVRAAKSWKCTECYEPITIGTKHERVSGMWDEHWSTHRTCLSCVEIRNHFACNGFYFGEVWEQLEGNFFPDMKAGGPCMQGLSPAAKARLFERRLKWLEDNNG